MTAKLKNLLAQLGLLCLIYTLLRGLFLAFNFQSYRQDSLAEIAKAFSAGLRVDIAAICRINALFICFSLLPFAWVGSRSYQRFLKVLFLLANVPFLFLNIVDFEYHKFTGHRSTFSLFDMSTEIPSQIGQLSTHYWQLVALAVLTVLVLGYFWPQVTAADLAKKGKLAHWAADIAALVVIAPLVAIGARGGWQGHPLTPVRAAIGDKENLSQLALNSTYTMINGNRKCDGMRNLSFFANDAELEAYFPPRKRYLGSRSSQPDNVVIIIVESLSTDYTGIGKPGRGYTPFLDSLARRGLYFKNSFADGRRSIDAPPSILAGLPHLRDETFYCAQFTQLHGIGSILKEHGYQTSFFHGGRNGTMHFDDFSRRMGFDSYYGLNEYPARQDSDGVWGIYDEPYLQYFARQLSKQRQPFASAVFTLSTHNPYKVPIQYENALPTGSLPIHQTVAYFDLALQKFFATAAKLPWYENTLFIITGDHIGPPATISPRIIDSYRVPIVFFHPRKKLPPVSRDKIVQHVDIAPTVLDYLGIDTGGLLPFGHSLFDADYPGLAFGQIGGKYWIADHEYYLEYRPGTSSKLFSFARVDVPVDDRPDIQNRLESKLRANLQLFNNGLATGQLYH